VEAAVALMQSLLHPAAVGSVVGQASLAELPRVLSACALYIGNDSGPKHIAAALGVPTIGIHSGVVDAIEWGPVGRRALALRRNMTCSPCYLANADDCPRALACLRWLDPALVHHTAELLLGRPVAPRVATPVFEPAAAAPAASAPAAGAPVALPATLAGAAAPAEAEPTAGKPAAPKVAMGKAAGGKPAGGKAAGGKSASGKSGTDKAGRSAAARAAARAKAKASGRQTAPA
jgi:hypothetical protein